MYKEKVDIISNWDEIVKFGSIELLHPAIIRLKKRVNKKFSNPHFSRKILISRDNSSCQYCGKHLLPAQITIDHILPKALGGKTSFLNCVVCCKSCNTKKSYKTLQQTNMTLLRLPSIPTMVDYIKIDTMNCINNWHNDWNMYFGG
jgi:5-methylcytosine-specific restriction endonuclease McrA